MMAPTNIQTQVEEEQSQAKIEFAEDGVEDYKRKILLLMLTKLRLQKAVFRRMGH
jgi:hypothetical protein